MSDIDATIRAVRDAESSAADVAGNMESALHLIQRADRIADAVQALEWASENNRSAKYRIEEALASARKIAKSEGGAA